MQLHPKKEEYVNNMPYCLHIWKPIDKEIPTPPSVLVGLRTNNIEKDIEKIENIYEDISK